MPFYDEAVDEARKAKAMSYLKEMGVANVVLEFSGGHDEGGVDVVTFYDAEDESIGHANSSMSVSLVVYKRDAKGKVIRDSFIPDWAKGMSDPEPYRQYRAHVEKKLEGDEVKELMDVLEDPVYQEYSSFAGEFEVSGTVSWNVEKGEAIMTASETEWVDQPVRRF